MDATFGTAIAHNVLGPPFQTTQLLYSQRKSTNHLPSTRKKVGFATAIPTRRFRLLNNQQSINIMKKVLILLSVLAGILSVSCCCGGNSAPTATPTSTYVAPFK